MLPKLKSTETIYDTILFYLRLVIDPYIFSGFISAFIASIAWMVVMSKFEISYAYPFMSLAPAIVFVLGIWLFSEEFSPGKVLGLVFIILGLLIMVKT